MSYLHLQKAIDLLNRKLQQVPETPGSETTIEPFILQWLLTEIQYFQSLIDSPQLQKGWQARLHRFRLDERATRDVGEADLELMEQLLLAWDQLLDLEVEFEKRTIQQDFTEVAKDEAYARTQAMAWEQKMKEQKVQNEVRNQDFFKKHSRRDKR